MHFQIDLDRKDSVIRLTIQEVMVSRECAEACYERLAKLTKKGGPYAGIYDLTEVQGTTIPTVMVRSFARQPPSIPTGRGHVVVGKFPVVFGLARLFQMCGESVGKEFEVVHTMGEAYEMLGVHPEDFTETLFSRTRLRVA